MNLNQSIEKYDSFQLEHRTIVPCLLSAWQLKHSVTGSTFVTLVSFAIMSKLLLPPEMGETQKSNTAKLEIKLGYS